MSRLARIDRLSSGDVRQAFLFSVARDFVHALPEGPLDLDLPAGAAIVGAMCHRLACDRRSAPDDGVDAFVRIYRERVARLDRDVDVVAKMFASLVGPKRIIDYLDRHRFEFDPASLFIQDRIVHRTVRNGTRFQPPLSHVDEFVKHWGRWIADVNAEPHPALIAATGDVFARRAATVAFDVLGGDAPPEPGYRTVFYDGAVPITFRTSHGLFSNCGMTTWPAGFVLAEYCLEHPVEGVRCLELGAGSSGLVAVVCARQSPASFVATDFDGDVLRCLASNLADNDVADRVAVRPLDWFNCTDDVLVECDPELILMADTIYSPDLIVPQVAVLDRAFRLGARRAVMANCLREPSTYDLLIRTLRSHSFHIAAVATNDVPERFFGVARDDDIRLLVLTR
ncbi:FAM86 N-terminal domain-containing protein [Plasmodiophora brassicae]